MDKLKGLDLEGKLVLDAGTGACGMTQYLREWGAEVVSIDYRKDWQHDCKKQVDKAQFITGDLTDMPYLKDDSFDFIVCNFLVSALSESKDLLITSPLREFYRVLKENGKLVIIDYRPFHENLYSGKLHDVQTDLWNLENAISELLGKGHLQEYSPEILEKELQAIGFSDTDISILMEKVKWPIDLLKEHEENIKDDIEKLDEDYIKEALKKKLKNIMKRGEKQEVKSGSIYELRAVK